MEKTKLERELQEAVNDIVFRYMDEHESEINPDTTYGEMSNAKEELEKSIARDIESIHFCATIWLHNVSMPQEMRDEPITISNAEERGFTVTDVPVPRRQNVNCLVVADTDIIEYLQTLDEDERERASSVLFGYARYCEWGEDVEENIKSCTMER